jgi:hypothetical protein
MPPLRSLGRKRAGVAAADTRVSATQKVEARRRDERRRYGRGRIGLIAHASMLRPLALVGSAGGSAARDPHHPLDKLAAWSETAGMSDADAKPDGRDETPDERADRNWDELMQELRVMQTGTQVLSGFLLAVAFQPRFTELDETQRGLYLVLVGLAALATVLSLTPVGLHRAWFGKHRKPDLVRFTSRIVKAALCVIGLLSIGVTTLIFDFVLDRTASVSVLIVASLVVLALWVVLPRLARRP